MARVELNEHERAVAEAIAHRHESPTGGAAVLTEVAELFSITVEEITGKKRQALIVDARCVVVFILRARGWTLEAVGALLNRHHVSVMNLEQRMANDFELRKLLKELAA